MDLLRDLLNHGHARGAVFAQTEVGPARGTQFAGRSLLAVHTVLEGSAWFERAGSDPVLLAAGSVMLLPRGAPYRIVPFVGAPALDQALGDRGILLREPNPEASARLLCGAYTMQAPLSYLLLSALSPLVPIAASADDTRLTRTVELIAEELADPRPGWQGLLDRTLDVLLALSLRSWFAEPTASIPGWYRALSDPVIGPAVYAIHADPAHAWTVAELAELGSVSRARFARRFTELIGRPPVASLTEWRMTVAAHRLLDEPGAAIATVATHVGYRSEYAFGTAFRRHYGESPGRWRAQQAL